MRVVRLSRACLVSAATLFLVLSAIWWQLVTVPVAFVASAAWAVWCIVVGGERGRA